MKRILSTLFCLLLIVAAFAQNTNEHLKFMGIPIYWYSFTVPSQTDSKGM